jgi:N4-gp56 family major capsid protein
MRLSIDLDNNRTPKSTKIISGSRMVDTKTINGARFLFIGSELIPSIKKMVDLHANPAFISVEKYAAAGNVARGEIGTVDQFRVIVVPEMMHWAGAGATEGTNDGYRATDGKYDVFPMLVVGDKSFTTIGFQTDGDTVKFKIYNKKPGESTADRNDPYGEMGFMSIKWYYGSMILRPERIALVKVVAEY